MSAAVSTSGQTSRRVGWTEGRSCSDDAAAMPLSLERIEELRDDCFAGDIDFDYDELKEWTEARVTAWFENGGSDPPPVVLEDNRQHESSDDSDESDDDDEDASYYDILEVSRQASEQEIKKAVCAYSRDRSNLSVLARFVALISRARVR